MESIQKDCSEKLHIGDIVQRKPETFSEDGTKNAGMMQGTVVYIHPLGRFHVVEVLSGVRESFVGVMK